jgi:hypothetical protein
LSSSLALFIFGVAGCGACTRWATATSQTNDGEAHIDRLQARRVAQSAEVKQILAKRTSGETAQIDNDAKPSERALITTVATGALMLRSVLVGAICCLRELVRATCTSAGEAEASPLGGATGWRQHGRGLLLQVVNRCG